MVSTILGRLEWGSINCFVWLMLLFAFDTCRAKVDKMQMLSIERQPITEREFNRFTGYDSVI